MDLDSAAFGRFVNHVVFRLSKKHRDGEITQREIRFDKRSFNSLEENTARLIYGNHGDRNDKRWLTFEYETVRARADLARGVGVRRRSARLRRGAAGRRPPSPFLVKRSILGSATGTASRSFSFQTR
jgi:hypothetical protein